MSFSRSGAAISVLNGITSKRITGTLPASEGGQLNIPHGLLLADIVGWTGRVEIADGSVILQGNTAVLGFEYQVFGAVSDMVIQLDASNSENVVSRPIEILIWYRA